MDTIYFKQRHEILMSKYLKEKEMMFQSKKENKRDDEVIHFGNMRYLEGQMKTILDICEGKYGPVLGTTR